MRNNLNFRRFAYSDQFLNSQAYGLTVADFLNIVKGERVASQVTKWEGYNPQEYEYLTGLKELAEFLGISYDKAKGLIAKGKISGVKKGKSYLFDTAKIREFAEQNPLLI